MSVLWEQVNHHLRVVRHRCRNYALVRGSASCVSRAWASWGRSLTETKIATRSLTVVIGSWVIIRRRSRTLTWTMPRLTTIYMSALVIISTSKIRARICKIIYAEIAFWPWRSNCKSEFRSCHRARIASTIKTSLRLWSLTVRSSLTRSRRTRSSWWSILRQVRDSVKCRPCWYNGPLLTCCFFNKIVSANEEREID